MIFKKRCLTKMRAASLRFVFVVICVTSVGLIVISLRLIQQRNDRIQLHELAHRTKLLTFHRSERWGLGNEMFALASAMCIVRKYRGNWILCLDKNAAVRRAFNLDGIPICDAESLLNDLNAATLQEEFYAVYDPRVETLSQNTHLVLDRFFQSWRYFVDCEASVRNLFTFKAFIWSQARQELVTAMHQTLECSACFEEVMTIGVHVRRGNMESNAQLKQFGYTVADSAYIERALKYIGDKLVLKSHPRHAIIVVSDDIPWCRDNLRHMKNVVFLSTNDAMVDMAVLSQCQHVLMTVGTFGWWGAWLANGTVIYYSNWPRKGSMLDKATSHKDYFPPSWIAM